LSAFIRPSMSLLSATNVFSSQLVFENIKRSASEQLHVLEAIANDEARVRAVNHSRIGRSRSESLELRLDADTSHRVSRGNFMNSLIRLEWFRKITFSLFVVLSHKLTC
jgi:hypothetical protein